MNQGQPAAALRALDATAAEGPSPRFPLRQRVRDAMYWSGDTALAVAAMRELARHADAPLNGSAQEREAQYRDMCVVEQWRLRHAGSPTAARAIEQLRRSAAPQISADAVVANRSCATLLQALDAAVNARADAPDRVNDLDSLLRTVPGPVSDPEAMIEDGSLALSRLRERSGDLPRALEAVRRRRYFIEWPFYLSTLLREEGRLATLLGDGPGALRAYRHYLALRANPEPAQRAEMERVRAEVTRLEKRLGPAPS
jgi:hypothetical protein